MRRSAGRRIEPLAVGRNQRARLTRPPCAPPIVVTRSRSIQTAIHNPPRFFDVVPTRAATAIPSTRVVQQSLMTAHPGGIGLLADHEFDLLPFDRPARFLPH